MVQKAANLGCTADSNIATWNAYAKFCRAMKLASFDTSVHLLPGMNAYCILQLFSVQRLHQLYLKVFVENDGKESFWRILRIS